MIEKIGVDSSERTQFIDITDRIKQLVYKSGIAEGCCTVYVPHTTAAVTINECADPSVKRDILKVLERLIPYKGDYQHLEGNSDAHTKASLVGSSVRLIIDAGDIVLGRWQGVFFCEFDGPRSRKVIVQIVRAT